MRLLYFTSYYGLSYEIRNKDNSGHTYPWDSIAPVLRAMYQPDREGYFYSPALPEPEPKRKNRAKDDNAPAISGPEQPERKKAGRTRAEVNYRTFAGLFPEMIDGEYRYMRFECGASMMPLHVQWIEDDVIAVSHTYEVEGDLLYDPEMTFRVDREAGTLEPLTFQQDGTIQLYQEVYPAPGKWIPKLRNDLSTFARQWFSNITEQRYFKVRAVKEIDGEDAEFTFDKDGNPIAEVDPFLSQRRRDAIAEFSPWWVDYLDVKAEHPDDVALYQVGDFFEL